MRKKGGRGSQWSKEMVIAVKKREEINGGKNLDLLDVFLFLML